MKKADYDIIAKYYDTVIGAGFETEELLNKITEKYSIDLKTVLELGCGTGENLKFFGSKYELTGFDISPEMIKLARKKLPEADLQIRDIRDYKFKKKFDLILCMYDTINHITLFSDWKKIFANTSRHLNPEGLFVFDINTVFKLEYFTSISPVIHEFGENYLIIHLKKISRNTFNWNIKVFEKIRQNNYNLTEANIKESSFEVGNIRNELEKHFKILKIEDDTGRKIKENSGRVFFVCQNK